MFEFMITMYFVHCALEIGDGNVVVPCYHNLVDFSLLFFLILISENSFFFYLFENEIDSLVIRSIITCQRFRNVVGREKLFVMIFSVMFRKLRNFRPLERKARVTICKSCMHV